MFTIGNVTIIDGETGKVLSESTGSLDIAVIPESQRKIAQSVERIATTRSDFAKDRFSGIDMVAFRNARTIGEAKVVYENELSKIELLEPNVKSHLVVFDATESRLNPTITIFTGGDS